MTDLIETEVKRKRINGNTNTDQQIKKTRTRSRKSSKTTRRNIQVMSLVAFGFTLMSYVAYRMLLPPVVDQLEALCRKSQTLDLVKLDQVLGHRVFGQHVAVRAIFESIDQYYREEVHASGPLVLSFHGGPGTGKTLVAHILSEILVDSGSRTHWVFPSHPHPEPVDFWAGEDSTFRDWIVEGLSPCATTLFVFEDVDKAPKWQLQSLEEVLRSWASDEELTGMAAILVLVSQLGHLDIKGHLLSVMSRNLTRQDVSETDLEAVVKSSMRVSEVLDGGLVSRFVVFLPLEREHVEACVRREVGPDKVLSNLDVERVFRHLAFDEDFPAVAKIGCKKVAALVNIIHTDRFNSRLPQIEP